MTATHAIRLETHARQANLTEALGKMYVTWKTDTCVPHMGAMSYIICIAVGVEVRVP